MEADKQGWVKARVELSGGGMEFVLHNGQGAWDNPPPWYGHPNYRLDLPSPLPPAPLKVTVMNGRVCLLDGPRVLVATDLDGTLVGHDDYLEAFKEHWTAYHACRGSILVYSTGRNLKDFLRVACEKKLLRPDYVVCGVGTEIYTFPDSLPPEVGTARLPQHLAALASKHQKEGKPPLEEFDPTVQDGDICYPSWCQSRAGAVFDEEWLSKMVDEFDRPAVIDDIHSKFSWLDPKGNLYHDPFRVSAMAKADDVYTDGHIDSLRHHFKGCHIIVSGGGEFRYVDVTPHSAGKLRSLLYLMEKLSFGPRETLVCGDSGNDLFMFLHPDIRGCCVANSQPDMIAFLKGDAEEMAKHPHLQNLHAHHHAPPPPSNPSASTKATPSSSVQGGASPTHNDPSLEPEAETMTEEDRRGNNAAAAEDDTEEEDTPDPHKKSQHVCFASRDCAGGILESLVHHGFDKAENVRFAY